MKKNKDGIEYTGFVDMGIMTGYYSFKDANYLVGTGKYQFEQSTPWGYVLKEKTNPS